MRSVPGAEASEVGVASLLENCMAFRCSRYLSGWIDRSVGTSSR